MPTIFKGPFKIFLFVMEIKICTQFLVTFWRAIFIVTFAIRHLQPFHGHK